MAVEVEVIGRGFYSRINGDAQEVPVGTKMVLKGVPEALKGKLKVIKDAEDRQLVFNDTPEAARLREEGKSQAADKVMAKAKEDAPKKRAAKK